jgi:hypothetical protein
MRCKYRNNINPVANGCFVQVCDATVAEKRIEAEKQKIKYLWH